MVEPSAASSGEMGGEDAVVGSGGVAGSVAGVAFGVERRSLSGFFSDRSFGAALTAGGRGSAGGAVAASGGE